MLQTPVPTNVTVFPETEQTVGGEAVKLMGRPEFAVALIVKGGVPRVWLAREPNVMVWLCSEDVTVKLCVTGVAGL
jgi:hypothetical protein